MSDLIKKVAGACQTGGLKQRQAADRLGGIETTAHQELEALLGIAELLANDGQDLLVALAQHRIRQIGLRFLQISKAVVLGHGGAAQAAQLRQHEPDPVAALAAGLQFPCGALVDGLIVSVLSRNKALELLGHG
jgi:hypothetical protein